METDSLFKQVEERLGDHGRVQIETGVQTPDGQRIVAQWYRHGRCAKRMVSGLTLTEVLRKVLLFEEEVDVAEGTAAKAPADSDWQTRAMEEDRGLEPEPD